jgi:hypothetical protein
MRSCLPSVSLAHCPGCFQAASTTTFNPVTCRRPSPWPLTVCVAGVLHDVCLLCKVSVYATQVPLWLRRPRLPEARPAGVPVDGGSAASMRTQRHLAPQLRVFPPVQGPSISLSLRQFVRHISRQLYPHRHNALLISSWPACPAVSVLATQCWQDIYPNNVSDRAHTSDIAQPVEPRPIW